jgi:hypothetical protein
VRPSVAHGGEEILVDEYLVAHAVHRGLSGTGTIGSRRTALVEEEAEKVHQLAHVTLGHAVADSQRATAALTPSETRAMPRRRCHDAHGDDAAATADSARSA